MVKNLSGGNVGKGRWAFPRRTLCSVLQEAGCVGVFVPTFCLNRRSFVSIGDLVSGPGVFPHLFFMPPKGFHRRVLVGMVNPVVCFRRALAELYIVTSNWERWHTRARRRPSVCFPRFLCLLFLTYATVSSGRRCRRRCRCGNEGQAGFENRPSFPYVHVGVNKGDFGPFVAGDGCDRNGVIGKRDRHRRGA